VPLRIQRLSASLPAERHAERTARGNPAHAGSYPGVAEIVGELRVWLWMSDTTLTRDAWDQLLRTLDPEVAHAAARYERLRSCLIALYRGRALPDPEGLADQVFDGVARSLAGAPERPHDVGAALREVAGRIAGEARRACREQAIALAALPPPPAPPAPHDPDDPVARLCRCLDELPRTDRWSLLEYEACADGDRSRRRRALAAELGIPLNALRVRIHRLRARLFARMGLHAEDRPRLDEQRVGQGQRAGRAAAERGQHEQEQLAGVDPHAERRRRLLIIADRLQRGAGRAVQQREHQAEQQRAQPRVSQ
jgi:hypothetical protein